MNCNSRCSRNCCTRDYLPPFYCFEDTVEDNKVVGVENYEKTCINDEGNFYGCRLDYDKGECPRMGGGSLCTAGCEKKCDPPNVMACDCVEPEVEPEALYGAANDIDTPDDPWEPRKSPPDQSPRSPIPSTLWDLDGKCAPLGSGAQYSYYQNNNYIVDCDDLTPDNNCDDLENHKWCYPHGTGTEEKKCLQNLYPDKAKCCEECNALYDEECNEQCHITPKPDDTCYATSAEVGYCLAKGFDFPVTNFNFEVTPECVPCPDEYDKWTHEDHLVPHNCIKQECSKEAGQFLNLM